MSEALQGRRPGQNRFSDGWSASVVSRAHYNSFKHSSTVILKYNMYTTNLRKVGGSVMLAVPPALLYLLRLRPGAKVGLAVQSGHLVVEPQRRPRYTLDELLEQCNPKAPRSKEEREWLTNRSSGGELI